jgi:hypothetical protein
MNEEVVDVAVYYQWHTVPINFEADIRKLCILKRVMNIIVKQVIDCSLNSGRQSEVKSAHRSYRVGVIIKHRGLHEGHIPGEENNENFQSYQYSG